MNFLRRHGLRRPLPEELALREGEAMRTDDIQAILLTLNDSCASARRLAELVDSLPTLRARITARYIDLCGDRDNVALAEQIAFLGNRELERILLPYLEDLVVLRCTGESQRPPPGDE